MCGIVGYFGFRRADKVAISALKRLEYRGYDSWGVAVKSGNELKVFKRVGAIGDVEDFELGEGNIGIGHCLHPDTVVLLSDGRVKKIKDLPEEVELIAYDFESGKFVRARGRVFRHKAKGLLRVKTSSAEILTTEQHKFFVFDKGIVEKFAKDLKVGDLLILPQNVEIKGKSRKLKPIDLTVYYEPNEKGWKLIEEKLGRNKVSMSIYWHLKRRERNVSNKTLNALGIVPDERFRPVNDHINFVRFPEETSPKLMRFLGYYFGDGSRDKRGIKFKDAKIEILREYLQLAKDIFSVEGRIHKEGNWFVLRINSIQLLKWLDLNFPDIMSKNFPEWIGSLTDEEVFAFIGGLFDAEGFVAKDAKSLAISTTDEFAMRAIQILLLRAGILASISYPKRSKRQKKQPVRLQVSNQDYVLKFLQKIGRFVSSVKRREIERLLNELKGHVYQHIKIPFSKDELGRSFGIKALSGRGYPMAKTVLKHGNEDLLKFLRPYLEAPVVFQKVLRVEWVDYDGDVYDIEVEGYRNFVANGIITHNSRWATHGKPSDVNAHPHTDCNNEIAVVHNGIISNFQKLREKLEKEGHTFKSETDTEVIPHLIEKYYSRGLSFEKAVMNAIEELEGSYAFVALTKHEDKLVACRYKSPLILGVGDNEFFLASDVPAMLEYTNRVIYLEDGDVVIITKDGYEIFNNGVKVDRKIELVPWSLEAAEKGGYEHFMLKEIHENPKVIEDTLIEYVSEDITMDVSFAAGISEIVFVACGTSYHASLVGKYVIEKLADIPVRVEYASEFNYHDIPLARTLVIGITQSGETADTLEALRKAKRRGARTLAITNVLGSSVTRIVDHVLYTRAGPEISVCATKTFIAQLMVLYIMAAKLSTMPRSELEEFINGLRMLSQKVRRILDEEDEIRKIAEKLADYENMMYIGRAIGYPIALEGALKMKEISYIHAEGYPAGELKHGPFALLGEKTPVVACVVMDNTYEIMLSNIKEVKARNSPVIAVADERDEEVEKFVDHVIRTPSVDPIFTPITYSVALQLLAYYTARKRGCEIDKPRHLAKSVTVE